MRGAQVKRHKFNPIKDRADCKLFLPPQEIVKDQAQNGSVGVPDKASLSILPRSVAIAPVPDHEETGAESLAW